MIKKATTNVPSKEKYRCNCISINCVTYVIKGANGTEVKARLKSVAFKGFKPYDLFVTGAMISVQTVV